MYITNYVKTLFVHGGYLWFDPLVSIDVALIHQITRIPMVGEDPGPLFADKKTERAVATQITAYYNLRRGNRGLLVSDITDKAT